MPACHSVVQEIKGKTDFTIALAGNPNVGKSSLFNQLTGLGVITANYPGKTVELNMGTTERDGHRIAVIDLPGTYALGAISDDQWTARQAVLEGKPDIIIVIVDATNLERNLYLVLQFLDLGLPVIVALNLVDEAARQGIAVDAEALSALLHVPVVPTVAVRGEGVDRLIDTAIAYWRSRQGSEGTKAALPDLAIPAPSYGRDVTSVRDRLAEAIAARLPEIPYGLSPRALALLLLEGDADFIARTRELPGGAEIVALAEAFGREIEAKHGEPAPLRIARERHGLAGELEEQVLRRGERQGVDLATHLWHLSVQPLTGLPILGLVLITIFSLLFYGGNLLSTFFAEAWGLAVSPWLQAIVRSIAGDGVIGKTLLWGLDAGIQAALSVGISYVVVFYFILAILEDSGYMNSIAFLTDSIMHRFGLHGRATIPVIAAAGCNVPAIIGTRVLTTMRERVIASMLIVLIPCGARTAVIMGGVGQYAGIVYALVIFAIVIFLVATVGVALNIIMAGKGTGIVMEMFPFRLPDPVTTLKKTWYRLKDFIMVAMPIVLLGSFILGFLYEMGWVWAFSRPLSPVVEGWLGLPPVAGLTLLFAVLRKELALQLLVALATIQYGHQAQNLLYFMTPNQLFVYALVNTIYIPCVATIAVLGKELGWRRTMVIAVTSIGLALLAGGVARLVLAAGILVGG